MMDIENNEIIVKKRIIESVRKDWDCEIDKPKNEELRKQGLVHLLNFQNNEFMEILSKNVNKSIIETLHFKLDTDHNLTFFLEFIPTSEEKKIEYLKVYEIVKECKKMIDDNFDRLMLKLIKQKLDLKNKPFTFENYKKIFTMLEAKVLKEEGLIQTYEYEA